MVVVTAKRRRFHWRTTLSVVVSLGVVALVVTQLYVGELKRTLEDASLPWLGIGL